MKIKHLLLLVITLYTFKASAQTFIGDTTSTKYFPATEQPASNWNTLDFNDASWSDVQGLQLFGFGDLWSVELPKVPSVYIRSFFNVENVNELKELMLYCDYDDGFVAYINGVEFARVNMGKIGTPTTFNQLTERSHELEFTLPQNLPVWGYYIDKEFIENFITNGKNVIGIEVHNDSIDGSDMSFYSELHNITDLNMSYNNRRYKKCVQLDSTLIPIISIETDEYGIPYRKVDNHWVDVDAKIGIIDNGPGNYNYPDDEYNDHEGNIKIRYRGESSKDFAKRPYKFELKDEQMKDTSVSLLGLPKEADWILQGPYPDKSQLRNAIVYELGRKTGHWAPRIKFVDLIVNGEYVGLYNLVEQIKRDSNRVYVAKLNNDEISGTDLTGGYILKYDKGATGIQIVYPKEDDLQDEQKNYILNFMDEYKNVLLSNDGLDSEIGYKKYINEESLIDYVIISELAKNADSYRFSSYFYKDKNDRDSRINYGPLWDFDLGFGNTIFQDGYKTEGWQYEYPGSNVFYVKRLFQDPELVQLFKDRWFELRESFLNTDSLMNTIDKLIAELEPSIKRNYEIWPVIDKELFWPGYPASTYEEEIGEMKNWIQNRVLWIDNNIANIHYDVTIYTNSDDILAYKNSEFKANLYPNPFTNQFYIDLNMPTSGQMEVEIINIQGKTVQIIKSTFVEKGEYQVFWKKGNEELSEGLHIINIKLNGRSYYQMKALIMK